MDPNSSSPAQASTPAQSVVFIDRGLGLSQIGALQQALDTDHVILLNDETDGVTQITQALAQYQNLESIHILSHGENGSVQLGNALLSQASLGLYEEDLQQWGNALTDTGDVLFYGCNLAAATDGIEFVQDISDLTRADVAASNDLTGHASLGGDWHLEVTTGEISQGLVIEGYQGILPIYNGKSYELTDGAKTWDEAQAEAQALGGNLVTVNDAAEETWLRETFSQTERLWIGLSDNATEGQFEWASGEAVTYLNWAPGEPNDYNGNEDFASLNWSAQGGWNDWTPTTELRGIIEVDLGTLTYNGNTYQVTDGAKTWDEAQAEAQALGGNLVTVNDAAEETWLRETFSQTERLWIGLSDNATEGQFEWASGEAVTYLNWAPGEPNDYNGNEDFASLNWGSQGGWNDWTPTTELRGIIEIVPTGSSTVALKDSDTIVVNEAAGTATVTVARTGDIQAEATVEYTLNELGENSATGDVDFIRPTLDGRPNTGRVVFAAGETEASFTIPIVNDGLDEGNETFAIGLQNPTGGTLGAPRTKLITIVDDDTAPTISLGQATLNVAESGGTVAVTVQRSGSTDVAATVAYSINGGTASAAEDFGGDSTGTLTFAVGQTSQTIDIPILEDALPEATETFTVTLTSATNAGLGGQTTTTVAILDNDLELGRLTRSTAVSGLVQPTTLDWTPDGRYMLIAEKGGVVKVVDNGVLQSTPLIDISGQVNGTRDRGLLGLAIHPDFANNPYVYLLYTYDPPETAGNTGLGGPDGNGNRPSRLVRVTVDPTTMVADPNSLTVLAGTNSTWDYTSRPDGNSTGDNAITPSGIVNGTTITAPASDIEVGTQDNDPDRPGIQNQNIRDYLATDSESHTIGDLEFGADGYLYLTNGDGTSYNFVDPRTIRAQDINNLSGKLLRIDPITGEGVATNPFYDGDGDSNQSKVFYSGLRNPFRFALDPVTDLPVIGEVGWNTWEEINTGPAGSNFGWPYFEGPDPTGGYQDLASAIAFYDNDNRNNPGDTAAVFPILSRRHGAPDNANAIVVGDFYNSNTLMFGDVNNGTLYAATLDDNRQVTNVQVFDTGANFVVDMKMGPDGTLYGVNLVSGDILRWDPDTSPPSSDVNLLTFGVDQDPSTGVLDFNDSSDYAEIDSRSTGGAFTFASWVNYDSFNRWSRVFDFGDGAANNNILLANITNTNDLGFHIYNGTGQRVGALEIDDFWEADTWIYLTATVDASGKMQVFKNGVLAGEAQSSEAPVVKQRTNNYIGRSHWSADGSFDGQLQGIQLIDRVLSATEVDTLFNQTTVPGTPTDPPTDPPTTAITPINGLQQDDTTGILTFDGTDDYGEFSGQPATGGAFTFSAWVNYDSFNRWSRVFDFGDGAANNNILLANVGNTNDLGFHIYNDTGRRVGVLEIDDFWEANTWIYLTATVDASGKMQVFKNGVLAGEAQSSEAPVEKQRTGNYIGRSHWSADGSFDGQLQGIQLLDRVLSAAEIIALFNDNPVPG